MVGTGGSRFGRDADGVPVGGANGGGGGYGRGGDYDGKLVKRGGYHSNHNIRYRA